MSLQPISGLRIGIIGAGALGSVIGGALALAGADVTLINRNAGHVAAINASGLMMRSGGEDRVVRLAATQPGRECAPVDLAIVLVKSFHTAEAVRAAASIIGPETTVLSLQNGLGHEDILAAIVGPDRVMAGKTYVGGVMLAPGHVIAGIEGKETIIGELDGRISNRVETIAAAFRAAGLATHVSDNIRGAMWDKLFVNVATGALAGITKLTYGDLYAVPDIEATAIAAVAEAMTVARSAGIRIATSDPRAPWVKAAAGLPPEFRTSMLQSLDKGSITEIDFINGAVVREGIKHGIPTPVNATLVACIKGIERALTVKGAAA